MSLEVWTTWPKIATQAHFLLSERNCGYEMMTWLQKHATLDS